MRDFLPVPCVLWRMQFALTALFHMLWLMHVVMYEDLLCHYEDKLGEDRLTQSWAAGE